MVARGRISQRLETSIALHPLNRDPTRGGAMRIHERPGFGNSKLSSARDGGNDLFDDRAALARDRELLRIEGRRVERRLVQIDDVPTRKIPRVEPSSMNDLTFSGLERQSDDVGVAVVCSSGCGGAAIALK